MVSNPEPEGAPEMDCQTKCETMLQSLADFAWNGDRPFDAAHHCAAAYPEICDAIMGDNGGGGSPDLAPEFGTYATGDTTKSYSSGFTWSLEEAVSTDPAADDLAEAQATTDAALVTK